MHFPWVCLNKKGYKCYHPLTRNQIVTMDVIFREIVLFFSSSQPYLRGEKRGVSEDDASLLLFVPRDFFDVERCHSKGEQKAFQKDMEPT